MPYWIIFMITAGLYLAGTLAYLGMIRFVEGTRQPSNETLCIMPRSAPN